jgi:hypothetical protein
VTGPETPRKSSQQVGRWRRLDTFLSAPQPPRVLLSTEEFIRQLRSSIAERLPLSTNLLSESVDGRSRVISKEFDDRG